MKLLDFLKGLGDFNYLWWVPLCIVFFSFHGWLSKHANEIGGKWILWVFVLGALGQFWVLIAVISKRLLFDAMLYDNILFLSYSITLIVLGCGAKLNILNWTGVGLVIFGSVLMRLQVR